jgi:hypothetical protein
MPDALKLDESTLTALMPEQRLMLAILRRAFDDLPISRRFFEADKWDVSAMLRSLGLEPQ